jgi:hypothetical protein
MTPRGRLLGVLLGLALPAARAGAQAPEPVLVELGMGRLVSRTVQAFRSGDLALVPLHQFLDMAELRATTRSDGGIEILIQPGNVPFVVDTAGRSWRLGKTRRNLEASQLATADGEVYLETGLLGRVLDLEIAVSWPDLQVVVIDPAGLPLARRVRRDAMLRSRLAASAVPEEVVARRFGLERPALSGLVLDYSILSPTDGPLESATYSTAFGLDLFGGSLSAGVQSQGADRPARSEVAWTGIWRESPTLAQLKLGDAFATGPRTRALRGISLTNSPYTRPAWLGVVPFSGELGPGWSVEAWRGGRMIGFDSVNALGQFSFDVPVQYGENPVDFVAYGPFGEIREFNRNYRARQEGIPAGRLEYGLSAGACRERCQATGNLDLRYGLTARWTLRGGVDRFWRDTLTDLTHPYVGLYGSVGNAWSVEAEAVSRAVLRTGVRFEPTQYLQLAAEVDRFAQGVQAPILTPQGRENQWTLSAFLRPLPRWAGSHIEASLDRINATSGGLTSGRLGLSVQQGAFRLLPSIRFQRSAPPTGPGQSSVFYGLNTFILPQPALGPVLGSILWRTTLDLERGNGVASTSAYGSLPILRGLRAESGITWVRGGRGPGVSFLLAAELPSVRTYTSVQAGGGRPATGAQYVQGSVIYNRTSQLVELSHGPSLERGGVTGRVFLDQNANGRFDAGEMPIPGVRIAVGHDYADSDTNGVYRVWDLLPFEPTRIAVDSVSLPSPLWTPAFSAASIEPSPNRYRVVDLPVVPGGVAEGRVVRRGLEQTPLAGVTLILRHDESGESRRVVTFSDGSFYAMGLKPGEWVMGIDPECLSVLKLEDVPIRFTMLADREGGSVSGLEVVLK